ncbi:MAG: BTAD domain-containing putative transcriptional regulator, partial [Chloroflexota bacterium]
RTKVAHLLYHLTQAEMTTGNHPQAYADIERLLTLAPWHEGAYQLKMRLLYQDGHRWAALEQYATLQAVLREELDVAPSAKTEALVARIRADEDLTDLDEYHIQFDHDLDDAADDTADNTADDTADDTATITQKVPTQERSQTVSQRSKRSSTQQERTQSNPQLTQDSPPQAFINCPAPLVPLIGHKETLNTIAAHLQDPGHRLVTLMGMGGVGKSHIALTVGQMFVPDMVMSDFLNEFPDEFPDGVGFVPLAGVEAIPETGEQAAREQHPEQHAEGSQGDRLQGGQASQDTQRFISAIASTLQLPQGSTNEIWTQVVTYLRRRTLLLILDNFEHVTGAKSLLTLLVQQAPRCTFLVTSRVRLHIVGETVVQVNPLPIPSQTDVEAMMFAPADSSTKEPFREPSAHLNLMGTHAYASIQLFIEYARRYHTQFTIHEHEFADVIQLCHLTGGLPLALRMIASWTEHFTIAQIAQQLRQDSRLLTQQTQMDDFSPAPMMAHTVIPAPVLQGSHTYHTLDAFFDQAWQLLSATEQQFLVQLAQFASSFDLNAAQTIVGAGMFELKRLSNTSLLQTKTVGRYELHPLTRTFLQRKWGEMAGDDVAQTQSFWDQYCRYYLTFVAEQGPRLNRAEAQETLASLRSEQDNIRLAWQQASETHAFALLERALDGLSLFYNRSGLFDEFFAHCQRLRKQIRQQQHDLHQPNNGFLFHVGVVELETQVVLMQHTEAQQTIQIQEELLQGINISLTPNLSLRYHFMYALLLRMTGQLEPFMEHLSIIEKELETNQPPLLSFVYIGRWYDFFARHLLMQGDIDGSRVYAEKALDAYDKDGNLWYATNILLVMTHYPERHQNLARLEQALSYSQQINQREGLALSSAWFAMNLSRKQHDQRLAHLHKAIAIYEEMGDESNIHMPILDLAREYIRLGQYPQAQQQLATLRTMAGVQTFLDAIYQTTMYEGLIETLQGSPATALRLTQKATDMQEQISPNWHGVGQLCHGYALLDNEQFDEANAIFEAVHQTIHEQGDTRLALIPRTGLAEVAYDQGHMATALAHVEGLLSHLTDDPDDDDQRERPEQIIDHFRLHWVCYQVLTEMGDGRADDVLQRSYEQLQTWADGIEDVSLRRSFLENVAVNRMIVVNQDNFLGKNR